MINSLVVISSLLKKSTLKKQYYFLLKHLRRNKIRGSILQTNIPSKVSEHHYRYTSIFSSLRRHTEWFSNVYIITVLSHLTGHGFGVDLTHVKARVVPLDAVDHQGPTVVPVVLDRHPRIVGHHVRVDGQYGLRVRT